MGSPLPDSHPHYDLNGLRPAGPSPSATTIVHHHLPPQLGRSAALHSLQINIWNSGAIAFRYSGRTTGYCDNGRTDSYCFLFRFVGEGNPPLRLCIVFNVDSCGRPPGVAPPGSHHGLRPAGPSPSATTIVHHHLPPQLGRSAALHSLQINIWNSGAIAFRYSA